MVDLDTPMHQEILPNRSSVIPHDGTHTHAPARYSPDASLPSSEPLPSVGAQIAATLAENRELRAQLEQLRSERNRLAETQGRIMELIGTASPEKLVHDIRNVLNERDLLKALVDEL